MFKCDICSHEFKSKSGLSQHKKVAKFCKRLQSTNDTHEEENVCEFCQKQFTTNYSFRRHLQICKPKQVKENLEINIINKLKEQIIALETKLSIKESHVKSLERDISKLSKKSSTTNIINQTNIINTSFNITQERFNKLVREKYTYTLYEKGGEGGKELIIEFLSDDNGVLRAELADFSRNKFRLIDDNSNTFTYIDNHMLFSLCKQSKDLKLKLEEYGKRLIESPDSFSYITNTERAMNYVMIYKKKADFTHYVFHPTRTFINMFTQNKLLKLEKTDENEQKILEQLAQQTVQEDTDDDDDEHENDDENEDEDEDDEKDEEKEPKLLEVFEDTESESDEAD